MQKIQLEKLLEIQNRKEPRPSEKKTRYAIHRAKKLNKIDLVEWRDLLTQNNSGDTFIRNAILSFLENLEEGRIYTKEFKKQKIKEFIILTVMPATLYIFILFAFWIIANYIRGIK
jgi:hypothetical protein